MATEKQMQHAPVSRMTLADLNRKNRAFHTHDASGSMMEKGQQLDPGDTVHNGTGVRAKVLRVQGGRVVVRLPDGTEAQWDLGRTHPAAETHDYSIGMPKSKEEAVRYHAGLNSEREEILKKGEQASSAEKERAANIERFHKRVFGGGGYHKDSAATENLVTAVEDFVEEENQEPAHQTDADPKLEEMKKKYPQYSESVLKRSLETGREPWSLQS